MIDVILLFLFVLTAVLGYHRGFIWQILKLCRLILLLAVLYIFGNQITAFITPMIKPLIDSVVLQNVTGTLKDQLTVFIIRLFLPVVVILFIGIITKQILRLFHGKIIKNIPLIGMLNAIMGSVVAMIQSILIFVLIVALLPVAGSEWNSYVTNNSFLVRFAQEQLPYLISLFQMYWS